MINVISSRVSIIKKIKNSIISEFYFFLDRKTFLIAFVLYLKKIFIFIKILIR